MGRKRFHAKLVAFVFIASVGAIPISSQTLSTKELVERNILAAGGREKISEVKNYSFQAEGKTYYLSSKGQMKITTGVGPVITEIVLINDKGVKRNCYNTLSEFSSLIESTYKALTKLRSGLFTLMNFQDQLELKGLKKFGLKKLYMLTSQEGNLTVDFCLDSEDFTLKRIALYGYDPELGRYEVNHDYGPLQEIEGIKIPGSWFSSQVGARGDLVEISDIKLNQSLEQDFFSNYKLNIGEVKIEKGILTGNITEYRFQRGVLVIGTNWTQESIQKAGFNNGDKLILIIEDREMEIDLFTSPPPRNEFSPGLKLLALSQGGENYLLYLIDPEFSSLGEKIKPLSPIQVRLKEE